MTHSLGIGVTMFVVAIPIAFGLSALSRRATEFGDLTGLSRREARRRIMVMGIGFTAGLIVLFAIGAWHIALFYLAILGPILAVRWNQLSAPWKKEPGSVDEG